MKLIEDLKGEYKKDIRENLMKYNRSVAKEKIDTEKKQINLVLIENEKILGGLTGEIYWNQMYIDILWVDDSIRNQGKGALLLEKAEEIAKKDSCKYTQLFTYSFQAPEFYKKMGYSIFGILENQPYDGCNKYYLKKYL